jgi:hypothetical protein
MRLYPNPTGAFLPGETRAKWRFGDSINSSKSSYWINAMVLSTSCPIFPPPANIVKSASVGTAAVGSTVTYTLDYSAPAPGSLIDTHNDLDGMNPPAGWSWGRGNSPSLLEQGFGYARMANSTQESIYYNANSAGSNGTLEVRMWQQQHQANGGIMFRYDPYTQNGYVLRPHNAGNNADVLRLYRVIGGTQTLVATWNLYGAGWPASSDPLPNGVVTDPAQYFWLRVQMDGCSFSVQIESALTGGPGKVGSYTDAVNFQATGYGGY